MIPFVEIEPVQLGPLTLAPFGLFLALGLAAGFAYAHGAAARAPGGRALHADMAAWYLVLGLGGAHIGSILFYYPETIVRGQAWTVDGLFAGLSSFGGLLGGVLGMFLFLRRRGLSVLPWLDVLVPAFALGGLFARIGCTLAHDHPGLPSDFFLAVRYPSPDGAGFAARHDLGFYELLFWVLMFPVYHVCSRRFTVDGSMVLLLMLTYGPVRFALDFLRINDATYLGLTFAQWCILASVPVAGWLARRLARMR